MKIVAALLKSLWIAFGLIASCTILEAQYGPHPFGGGFQERALIMMAALLVDATCTYLLLSAIRGDKREQSEGVGE